MSEETADKSDKKAGKKKRRASEYMVLNGVETGWQTVAHGNSITEVLDLVVEKKITGELLVVCVRQRLKSEIQESVKLT